MYVHKDYHPAHIKVSPIPRRAGAECMGQSEPQGLPTCTAHIKGITHPRLAQELIRWDSLNNNGYQPAHVRVSPIPRLVQELNVWAV